MLQHNISITYYEYDPSFPTEFELSLAGTPEVNGDHVATIAFQPGIAWSMKNELGEEVAIPSSFLFTSAGETYTLLARGSLPPDLDTWTTSPIPYGVGAGYAPAWAQLEGEIIPTINRSTGECTLTEPITVYAPVTDTTVASIDIHVGNWPFGGIGCGQNANCFGGTVAQEWTEQVNAPVTGSVTVAVDKGDTAFLQRDFDISGTVSTPFSIEEMSPVITTTYHIWKECGSRTVYYEWSAVREAGTGSITWGELGNNIVNDTTVVANVTSRMRVDITSTTYSDLLFGGGAYYMMGSYSLNLILVAHD